MGWNMEPYATTVGTKPFSGFSDINIIGSDPYFNFQPTTGFRNRLVESIAVIRGFVLKIVSRPSFLFFHLAPLKSS